MDSPSSSSSASHVRAAGGASPACSAHSGRRRAARGPRPPRRPRAVRPPRTARPRALPDACAGAERRRDAQARHHRQHGPLQLQEGDTHNLRKPQGEEIKKKQKKKQKEKAFFFCAPYYSGTLLYCMYPVPGTQNYTLTNANAEPLLPRTRPGRSTGRRMSSPRGQSCSLSLSRIPSAVDGAGSAAGTSPPPPPRTPLAPPRPPPPAPGPRREWFRKPMRIERWSNESRHPSSERVLKPSKKRRERL